MYALLFRFLKLLYSTKEVNNIVFVDLICGHACSTFRHVRFIVSPEALKSIEWIFTEGLKHLLYFNSFDHANKWKRTDFLPENLKKNHHLSLKVYPGELRTGLDRNPNAASN